MYPLYKFYLKNFFGWVVKRELPPYITNRLPPKSSMTPYPFKNCVVYFMLINLFENICF